MLDYYGLTESYPLVANYPWMDVREGSMGRPMPGWDVQILDEDENEPLPRGERGEICLRARSNPHYPLGYWNNDEAARETFGGDWFHTKDAAVMDEDGYVWYAGRADDVIISAGYRIGPFEVESACIEHPAVREAAAVASPDERRGNVVKAFIVLAEGHERSDELAKEISAFVRDRLSQYAYPRKVEFVDDLPKTLTGKIRRIDLRERESAPAGRGLERRVRPARIGGLRFTPGGTISSIRSSTSSESSTSAAPSCDSSCSIVRGPMIGAVTAGWRITNAIAMWISDMPGLLGQQRELLDGVELALVRRASTGRSAAAGARRARLRRVLALAPLARQPAAGERAPRDHAHAVALAGGQHVGSRCRGRASSTAAARRRSARGRAARRPTAPRRSATAGTSTSRCSGPCPGARGR